MAVIAFLLATTSVACATPCPTVDLTYAGTGAGRVFANHASVQAVEAAESGGVSPCARHYGGMRNTAYPACLALVQDAVVYLATAIGAGCTNEAVLTFGGGQTYDFSNEAHSVVSSPYPAIDVSGVSISPAQAGLGNRLIIQGALDRKTQTPTTRIITNNHLFAIFGVAAHAGATTDMSHITIRNIVFQQSQDALEAADPVLSATVNGVTYGSSQGIFGGFTRNDDGSDTGLVTIEVQAGFPSPAALFDAGRWNGRFLRVYDNSNPADPVLVTADRSGLEARGSNAQVAFGEMRAAGAFEFAPPAYCRGGQKVMDPANYEPFWTCAPMQDPIDKQKWTLVVGRPVWTLPTTPGAADPSPLVCIKSKPGWGDAYRFDGRGTLSLSQDIVFSHVTWLTASRGLFIGVSGVQVIDAAIPRLPAIGGQAPCIANSAGGPQIGDATGQYSTSGNIVKGLNSAASGDDPVALFFDATRPSHDTSPPAEASRIVDSAFDNSFAPILLDNSANVYVADPTSATDNAPDFAASGNRIVHCDAERHAAPLAYPFDNPAGLNAPDSLCGIAYKDSVASGGD